MNGSLYTVEGRSVLRFERRLGHPPEKVWRALTEPEELAAWYPADIQGERKQGAPIRFVSSMDDKQPQEGEITEFDPPRLLAYTWGPSLLRWELHPDGAGCLLVFTQTFDDRPFAASYATGWQLCLDGLDRVLAGRPEPAAAAAQTAAPAAATRLYRARHEGYVEVFGLLEGTAEPSGAGWLVRFARLLPYPAAEVWDALTAGDGPAAAAGDSSATAAAGSVVAAPGSARSGGTPAGPPAGQAAAPAEVAERGTGRAAPAAATAPNAPAGPVTEFEPGAVLAYDSPGGAVRWTLTPGPGGTLVEVGQQAAHPAEALAGWHARLEEFAAALSAGIGGTPPEVLHARYAALVAGLPRG